MDQEDFEEMASIGEQPTGDLRSVFLPGAAESGNQISAGNLYFDASTGRIYTTPNSAGTDVYELLNDGSGDDNH